MADRAKFLDFLDMIDGGGAGKMGGEFEGGGIFSQLANLVATPYGSEDERRKKMRMEFYLDKLGTPEEQAKAAAATAARNTPSVVKKTPPAPMVSGGPTTRGGQRGPRVAPAGPPMPATAMSPVMPNQPMSTYDEVMPQANPMAGLGMGPATRGGRRGAASASSGNQVVPAMTNYNPTVPAMAGSISSGNQFSPVFSQDYADYLEYLMTGHYPRG